MTLRIVAADYRSVIVRVSVRDPTGSPEARYPSTTRRNTSRERSFISANIFAPSVNFRVPCKCYNRDQVARTSMMLASLWAAGLIGRTVEKGICDAPLWSEVE